MTQIFHGFPFFKGGIFFMASNPSLTKHALNSQVEGRRRGDFSREQARSVSGGWAALDDKTIVPVFLPAVFVLFGAYGGVPVRS
jgi:hypothetical protein